MKMKALILSGGKGTRLKPLTHTIAKQLIPVANKPILSYVMDHVSQSGIKDMGIIIAPETGEAIKAHIKDGSIWRLNVTYIMQEEPLGLAHAVKVARPFLKDSPFVMYLGDNLLKEGIKESVKSFKSEKQDALIYLKKVDNPSAFGVAQLDKNGNIIRLVEKPKRPISNLALVGVYLFSPKIHKSIDGIKPSRRGELEITDAISKLIKMGGTVKYHILDGWWLDTGKKDDLLAANTAILDDYLEEDIQTQAIERSSISGRIRTEKGTKIINSTIRGPVAIGKNALIRRSFIGPYTSIGDNVKIIDSVIEHAVILEGAEVLGVERLEDSIIGRETKVIRGSNKHKALRLLIGDFSHIEV